MNNANKAKIKQLPQEVFYLLTADKAADLSVLLIEKYDLDGIQSSAMVELVEAVYLKELRLAELYNQVKAVFNFDDTKLRQFICDLAGYKFLAISDWLGEDVANYIRSLGANASDYLAEVEELRKLAATELAADTMLWQADPEPAPIPDDGEPMNVYPDDPDYLRAISEETTDLDASAGTESAISPELALEQFKDLLSSNLLVLLASSDQLFISEFNYRLINLLVDHPDFKDALISVLLTNSLQIGTETIVIDGRQILPSIGAWINYFINQKGSIMFDAVTLSDFLINSASAKFLASTDKDLLSRLLWLYRNLKFFPDSLVGDNPNTWEILTYLDDPDYRVFEAESVPLLAESRPVANNQATVVNPVNTKLSSLQTLAKQYPDNSLERLAIDEEIKRLSS